jgi:archaellin
MVLMAAILGFALLLAGCTDHGTGSQPPASSRTLAPTPVKPTTVRTLAVPTAAATSPESTATPRPGTVGQGGSPLQVTGPVLGFRGTGGSYLDLITFRVVKGPSADPVDMEHVQITLTRHDETTGLRYEIREQKNGDQDGILENGEMFTIAVPVMPSYWIYRNEPFELRVLVPGSASIQIRSRGPDVMEEQNLLAEA